MTNWSGCLFQYTDGQGFAHCAATSAGQQSMNRPVMQGAFKPWEHISDNQSCLPSKKTRLAFHFYPPSSPKVLSLPSLDLSDLPGEPQVSWMNDENQAVGTATAKQRMRNLSTQICRTSTIKKDPASTSAFAVEFQPSVPMQLLLC